LPGFTRPHFPGKLGQKPGKPGLARLCQAGRVFDRAPDARDAGGSGTQTVTDRLLLSSTMDSTYKRTGSKKKMFLCAIFPKIVT